MKIALTALALVLLSGCGITNPFLIETKPIERIPLTLPAVDQLYPEEVKWVIVTPKNVDEVFAKLKKNGDNIVLFSLTSGNYESAALNMAEVQKLVKQLRAQVKAYQEYYIIAVPKTPKK